MICTVCREEIKPSEPYFLIGLDGDFIHVSCQPRWNEIKSKIDAMTDEEFERWITEGAIR